ncbi:MAG: response regulator transcription factor [Chloroflexi bacterium]|nr:response regulator transcription factor [Chloroflexota bacterium]
MIRILVADDHAVVRQGIRQIVADAPDMEVVDEASSGPEVLEKALKRDYDLVLLDITMPGSRGLDILAELKERKPELRILVLSIHPEEQYALRALRLGASGYLTKESAPTELITAIRKASLGTKYVSSSLAEQMAGQVAHGNDGPLHQTLSDREYEVLRMIASGKIAREIAEELCLATKTVNTYRSRLRRKMGMKNDAELIRYAIRSGLVD